ncbi:hypothetical protein KI387_004157, partial [Taxus chinensis]
MSDTLNISSESEEIPKSAPVVKNFGRIKRKRIMVITCRIEPRLLKHEDVRDNHLENIVVAMQTIMSMVLNDYDDIPQHLLTVLKEELRQETSCIARTLAKGVMNQCSIKLKTYMAAKFSKKDMGVDPQGMSSLVHNGELFVSNTCIECEGTEKSDVKVKDNQENVEALREGYSPTNKNKNANGKLAGLYSTAIH